MDRSPFHDHDETCVHDCWFCRQALYDGSERIIVELGHGHAAHWGCAPIDMTVKFRNPTSSTDPGGPPQPVV